VQQEGVGPALSFSFDNVESQGAFSRTLTAPADRLKTDHPGVVVSKSAGPPEPPYRHGSQARAALEARAATGPASGGWRFSMAGSALDPGRKRNSGWLPRFDMFDWVAAANQAITSAVGFAARRLIRLPIYALSWRGAGRDGSRPPVAVFEANLPP